MPTQQVPSNQFCLVFAVCGWANRHTNMIIYTPPRLFNGYAMAAFARPHDRSDTIGPRFDYFVLAPAAAAICYPFLPPNHLFGLIGPDAAIIAGMCELRIIQANVALET